MKDNKTPEDWVKRFRTLPDGSNVSDVVATDCGVELKFARKMSPDYRYPSPKIERYEDVPICRRCGRCHVESHWQTERLRLTHDGGSAVSLEYFDRENDEWRIADDMDAKELRALGSAAFAMADILEETKACDG